jgi:hypothetical protein
MRIKITHANVSTLKLLLKYLKLFSNILLKNKTKSWTLVANPCNPSFSEGSDQEGHSSKPAQANSFRDPIWKKIRNKTGQVSSSRCGLCVQTSVPQKEKKKRLELSTNI